MAENTQQTMNTIEQITVTPADQFIFGAVIAVGVGILAVLTQVMDVSWLWAVLVGYLGTAIAYGVYLMQNSTAIHAWWKWLAILLVSVVAFALTQVAQNYISIDVQPINAAIVAALVITVANFALNDLQEWKSFLPDSVVNSITAVIGGVTVAAEAVKNAPSGSVISISTLLATVVPVLIVYIFQLIPWPPTSTGTSGTTTSTVAHPIKGA